MQQSEPMALVWTSRDERDRASGWRPANIRKSFSPATVIDVGVAHGTPGLYGAFPGAHYVLIEPLEEYRERLEHHIAHLDGEYHLLAAGDREGPTTLRVDVEAPPLTSVLTPSHVPGQERRLVEREIQMTTLDALWDRQGWEPPFALKVDTEGYEDKVILGATRLLEQTQVVIAEASVPPRYQGGYTFAELIALMDSRGFRLCDLLDGIKSHENGELIFVDAVFRRI